jgi:hypothetical protein
MKGLLGYLTILTLSSSFAADVAHPRIDTLPFTTSKELNAVWKVQEATFSEELTTGVHATLSITNMSASSRTSDRILASYFDSEGRECFKLVFDVRLSDRAGPAQPGETRTMIADTSLVFPSSRPARMELSQFNAADASVPITILALSEDSNGPISLNAAEPIFETVFVTRAIVTLDAHVSDLNFLEVGKQVPTAQISRLIRSLRFALGSGWDNHTRPALLLMGIAWQPGKSNPASMEVPDQNPVVRNAVRRERSQDLPYVEILRFEYEDYGSQNETATDLSGTTRRAIKYDEIGTGWCDPLLRLDDSTGTGLKRRTWSDSVNKVVLTLQDPRPQ